MKPQIPLCPLCKIALRPAKELGLNEADYFEYEINENSLVCPTCLYVEMGI